MRMLSYTRLPGWQGFPNLLSLGETAMPSLRSAAVGKLLFVHQKYNLLHKSCKARNMLWTGFTGYVTFQLLARTLLRRMLVSKYFSQVNYRTSVSCYTLSKVGWSFVYSIQDTCSEKKKEFGNP